MAIFKPSESFTASKVVDGSLFQLLPDKSAVMQEPSNNRSPPSPAFAPMDSLVMSLDATYELLPNQAEWIDYVATIVGQWQLCANCQPDSTAKKFFRQVNFNRSLLGLGKITAPIFSNPPPTGPGVSCFWDMAGAPVPSLTFDPMIEMWDGFGIVQLGLVLGNPIQPVSAANQGMTFGPLSNEYATWVGLKFTGDSRMCICDVEGQPGNTGELTNTV